MLLVGAGFLVNERKLANGNNGIGSNNGVESEAANGAVQQTPNVVEHLLVGRSKNHLVNRGGVLWRA
jgi:hypothetical protein